MQWVVRLLITGFSLLIADRMLDSISIDGVITALFAAVILGIVNIIVRPILIFFTLPVTLITFGLFLWVINGITYWLTSSLVPGFDVTSIWGAMLGSLITTITNGLVQWIIKDRY